jgi:SagB-type dehydrogenase family enzyme
VYVAARCVDDLPVGIYHWASRERALRPIPAPARHCLELYDGLLYVWHRQSAALIIVTVRGALVAARYGDRAERLALLEAGAVLQNLSLVVSSLGLAGGIVGSPLDALFADALLLDTEDELPVAAFALGHPPATAERDTVALDGDDGHADARAPRADVSRRAPRPRP